MPERIRLNVGMRDELIRFSEKVVEPKKERRVYDAAYAKAKPLVLKAVAAKYPPKEMAILKKYGCGTVDETVKLSMPNGVFHQFRFEEDDRPYTADQYDRAAFLGDEETAKAVETWADALTALKSEKKARLEAYRALILGSTYLDQVTSVWPEAAGLIQPNRLPIALNAEQIALVKSDVRERKAAA